MKQRAVFYARVSTEEERQVNALGKQIEENREVIASKGWELVDEYIDEGKSGTKVKGRTEYQRLLSDMEDDKFDIIVIKSQDRLQRNTKDWYIFADHLNRSGKELYLYLENKFYTPSEDALITGIKAILAEEYSRDLSKKLNNSNKRRIEKAKNGERISAMGNGQTYGYSIVNGQWVVDETQREIVSKMFELYLDLHSIRKVRNALNDLGYRNQNGKLFTDEIVVRVIRNEKHKGWVILNRFHRNFDTKEIMELPEDEWVIVKDDHEPIVSEEVWDKVNKEIDSHRNKGNAKGRGRKVGEDPLSGKMFCASCGGVLWKHQANGYKHWYCSGKMGRGELACDKSASISAMMIKKYLSIIVNKYLDFSTIEYSKAILKKNLIGWLKDLRKKLVKPNDNERIARELEKLEKKKDKLLNAYVEELIGKEEFKAKRDELDNEIKEKQALLVPVEEHEDIKAIDDAIANIDREIELLFEDEAFLEDNKIKFLMSHIKEVRVLQNKDIFVIIDGLAGAFLFIDGGKAEIFVTAEGEEGFPFVDESMQIHYGGRFITVSLGTK